MIKGVGIDIESTRRIGKLLARYGYSSLQLIFTTDELERCHRLSQPAHYLTICFAAKEALSKALGTGLATIDWNEIEADEHDGRVLLTLYGKALKQIGDLGVTCWQAQWFGWHDQRMVVVILRE